MHQAKEKEGRRGNELNIARTVADMVFAAAKQAKAMAEKLKKKGKK